MAPSFQHIPYRQSISLCARLGGDGGRVDEFSGFRSDFPASPLPCTSEGILHINRLNSLPIDLRPTNRPRRVS